MFREGEEGDQDLIGVEKGALTQLKARRQLVGISSHLPLWDLGINLRSSSLATNALPFQATSLALLRSIISLSLMSDERLTDARKWIELFDPGN